MIVFSVLSVSLLEEISLIDIVKRNKRTAETTLRPRPVRLPLR